MPARSYSSAFTVNDHLFYVYQVEDSHGTHCNVFTVDCKHLKPEEFYAELEKALKAIGGWKEIMHVMKTNDSMGDNYYTHLVTSR